MAAVCSTYIGDFRLDASADSLLMEGDQELIYSREINSRYGIQESVIVAFTPNEDLFSRESLDTLSEISERLLSIKTIESVDSILNVPIFSDTPLTGISENYLTLLDEAAPDRWMWTTLRREFSWSKHQTASAFCYPMACIQTANFAMFDWDNYYPRFLATISLCLSLPIRSKSTRLTL